MPKNRLIDLALASFDIQQRVSTRVAAAPARVFAALTEFDPQCDAALRAAFALHDAPAVLCGGGDGARSLSGIGPLRRSAMALRAPDAADPGELVLGFVGKFWWPVDPIAMPGLEQFCGEPRRDVTKVVWGFGVGRSERQQSTLVCTLRARSNSWRARAAFGAYWSLIAVPSRALRVRLVDAVKQVAEG